MAQKKNVLSMSDAFQNNIWKNSGKGNAFRYHVAGGCQDVRAVDEPT